MLLGTTVNTLAIVAGSLVGLFFRRFIPSKQSNTMIQAVAFAIILMGLKMAWETEAFILMICSLAFGSGFGGMIGIEDRLEGLANRLQKRFVASGEGMSKAFVFTSLLYCVGSLAIMGALESGLQGNHDILFAKSVLDGLGSILFAATMGVGVLFSAVPVFLYQGGIAVTASFATHLLTPEVISQISAVGGLLIVGMGFNMLGAAKIKVGDMLPAVFIPFLVHIAQETFALVF
ncbi:MAG: DUF554 domain-containing protein [Deltaproteobacteria bacterium]|nr:DUF554 domain-containing protein [Deltaproteobacteria bacterium]